MYGEHVRARWKINSIIIVVNSIKSIIMSITSLSIVLYLNIIINLFH